MTTISDIISIQQMPNYCNGYNGFGEPIEMERQPRSMIDMWKEPGFLAWNTYKNQRKATNSLYCHFGEDSNDDESN